MSVHVYARRASLIVSACRQHINLPERQTSEKTVNCAQLKDQIYLLLSSQASHWAAFAGNALISVGDSPAYKVCLPPAHCSTMIFAIAFHCVQAIPIRSASHPRLRIWLVKIG